MKISYHQFLNENMGSLGHQHHVYDDKGLYVKSFPSHEEAIDFVEAIKVDQGKAFSVNRSNNGGKKPVDKV